MIYSKWTRLFLKYYDKMRNYHVKGSVHLRVDCRGLVRRDDAKCAVAIT